MSPLKLTPQPFVTITAYQPSPFPAPNCSFPLGSKPTIHPSLCHFGPQRSLPLLPLLPPPNPRWCKVQGPPIFEAMAVALPCFLGSTCAFRQVASARLKGSSKRPLHSEKIGPCLLPQNGYKKWLVAAVEDKVSTNTVLEKESKPAVSAAIVKQLRDETGAGMMDCKKALAETGGDLEKAREFLRKKGLASAAKKSSRIAAEGRIGSYIHDNRIGVLIEVNCETDFVARGEIFQQLVDDLAMQVVACPAVQFVSVEEVPEELLKKEREIEMQKEDLLKKPEAIRAKIVEGRISKRLGELALLEQPYIKDDSILVKDLVKQTVATLGENIRVRRFNRFTLGEGLEKRSQDFAAEVAAQAKAKS